jgi:hypothetical protein
MRELRSQVATLILPATSTWSDNTLLPRLQIILGKGNDGGGCRFFSV